ncbi:7-carboxy-7-deazaguanine synthase [Marinobacterium sediminicola]|uniref:7-carboxy-7-deazaguanine synthase n=1 Tax=Marinobacterium sediminicola TaxID=518898 RepID=A0ABY1RVR0_9GAMM|nr:7-carboxy-7-deazaguanine synthase [Marinobacterium sediminicola]ULG70574.1 7-carboxy-7-deazaguanine synthase [Marinobacterium sediminicola]SMR68968.1 7-carboxy-7-deazaguanine synthase, Cx14CxxC type [Marinobacterium sediminicola]
MYSVKEIFYTLQGEGAQSGRASVFCRFTGCNLWSGREQDRHNAICDFCDTDFIGTDGQNGGKFSDAEALAERIESLWPDTHEGQRYVVCTGGEPALQLDTPLIDALHARGFEIAIETNGTKPLPSGIDWICVSPKGSSDVIITEGDELKLVFPQSAAPPERFSHLNFRHFFLQPLDSPLQSAHTRRCIDYCMAHPQWRLSLQTHKITGID